MMCLRVGLPRTAASGEVRGAQCPPDFALPVLTSAWGIAALCTSSSFVSNFLRPEKKSRSRVPSLPSVSDSLAVPRVLSKAPTRLQFLKCSPRLLACGSSSALQVSDSLAVPRVLSKAKLLGRRLALSARRSETRRFERWCAVALVLEMGLEPETARPIQLIPLP